MDPEKKIDVECKLCYCNDAIFANSIHYINFLCLDVFLSLKMYLKIKMTLQTTFSSNLKSFGSGPRKENWHWMHVMFNSWCDAIFANSIPLYQIFLCLDVFLSFKMYLKTKMTLQTTFSSNLKSFGSGPRKENWRWMQVVLL